MAQIDRDQKSHQDYVSGSVSPWLSQALTNLTGVDPAHPGINTTLQQQYLGNVQGIVGGAMNAAATATPGQVQATTPGGIVASPTAYLSTAAREGAQGRSSAMLQAAQAQSAMNTMQPNTQAQGYLYQLADYAKGLPQVYAERRSEARTRIDEFTAKMQQDAAVNAERARHNRVTEAISATNASTNAAFQASRLGLDASDQAYDQSQDLTAASAPVPEGYIRLPNGDYRTDPTYVAQGSGPGGRDGTSTRDARGRKRVPVLRDEGWTRFGDKPPAKYNKSKFTLTQGADGGWWLKPKGGGSAPSAAAVARARGTTSDKVFDKVQGSFLNGSIADDQPTATGDLLRILKPMQPTNKANFAAWWAEVAPILRRIDPRYEEWMTGYIKRRKAGVGGVSWKGLL